MTFLWPFMLFSLVLVPLLVVIYLRVQRKRRALTAGFSRVFGDKPSLRRGPGLRRYLPPVLFLMGVIVLLVALARPQAEVNLPRVEGTVMLVFDVSGSMAADDVKPSRMEAAKEAARAFVKSQPETIRIGIVSFSGSGFAVARPTNNTQNLLAAINRLEPQTGTSLGQGILAALNAIALDAGMITVAPTATPASPRQGAPQGGVQGAQQQAPSATNLLASLPEGPYPPAVIVLLTDGENNQSIDPVIAAQAASERQVRIDTLGFGTTAGAILDLDGFKVHSALDEPALKQIAQTAGGEYYYVQDEPDPQVVYANLRPELIVKSEKMEITSIFAGASIIILLLGGVFSMVWFNRLP